MKCFQPKVLSVGMPNQSQNSCQMGTFPASETDNTVILFYFYTSDSVAVGKVTIYRHTFRYSGPNHERLSAHL